MQNAADSAPEPTQDRTAIEPAEPPRLRGTPSGERPVEIGGRPGPEPTRYGDWEKNGRCIDF